MVRKEVLGCVDGLVKLRSGVWYDYLDLVP